MIKTLRFAFFRRLLSRIKCTECCQCHIIHINIHFFQTPLQQRFYKSVIICMRCLKPSSKHPRKHAFCFQIRNTQSIPWLQKRSSIFHIIYIQITTGEHKTPNRIFILIQLIKHNLLIKSHQNLFSVEEIFHLFFDICRCRLNQIAHQAIRACRCPIWI